MYFCRSLIVCFYDVDISQLETARNVVFMELLQLLKAHFDFKERTKLLSSCDVMAESTVVVNPRSVSCW